MADTSASYFSSVQPDAQRARQIGGNGRRDSFGIDPGDKGIHRNAFIRRGIAQGIPEYRLKADRRFMAGNRHRPFDGAFGDIQSVFLNTYAGHR